MILRRWLAQGLGAVAWASAVALGAVGCHGGARERPALAHRGTPAPPAADPALAQWQSLLAQCDSMRRAVAEAVGGLPDSIAPSLDATRQRGIPDRRSYEHPEANLGVGVLKPDTRGGEESPPWQCGLLVPLYQEPARGRAGWIVGGFLETPRRTWPEPLRMPVLSIGQGESGLIVLEARPDGWIRFRFRDPYAQLGNGTAWTHTSSLALGPVHLAFVRWEDFLGHDTPPLVYRDGERHTLFAAPDSSSERLAWIEGDYGLVPLEFRGGWARVTLEVPNNMCPSGSPPKRTEGWIPWRDSVRGPLVWVAAWDC